MLSFREGSHQTTYLPEPTAGVRADHALYESEDGMTMEREVQEVVYALVRATKPLVVVETGTYFGGTSEVIGNALHDNDLGILISIELDPNYAEIAQKRCRHLSRVWIFTGNSLYFASRIKRRIDMLIVDGSDPRGKEQLAFEHLLNPHALVLRHDVLKPDWDTRMMVDGSQSKAHVANDPELAGYRTLALRTPRGLAISQRDVR